MPHIRSASAASLDSVAPTEVANSDNESTASSRNNNRRAIKKTRTLTGDEAVDLETAQASHERSGSAYAKGFEKPLLTTGVTHNDKGDRLTSLACKDCGKTVLRPLASTSTTQFKRHLLQHCPHRPRENGQSTLSGGGGVDGSKALTREEVLQILALWCSENGRPFAIVRDERFQLLLHPLIRKMITDRFDKEVSKAQKTLYEYAREYINAMISALLGKKYLGLDVWTAPNGVEVCGYVLYGRDSEGKMVELPLTYKELTESHTAEYLAKVTREVLVEFGLLNDLAGIVSDNATVNSALVALLGEDESLPSFNGSLSWIRCFAHVVNLITQAVLSPFAQAGKVKGTAGATKKGSKTTYKAPEGMAELVEADVSFEELLAGLDLDREDGERNRTAAEQERFAALIAEIVAKSAETDAAPDNTAEAPSHNKRRPAHLLRRKEDRKIDLYTTATAGHALRKFQLLAKSLRYSGKARKIWNKICDQNGRTHRRVRRAVDTRWNSKLLQCEDVVEMSTVIDQFQKHSLTKVPAANRIQPAEILLAKHLVKALKPLEEITCLVSTSKVATIGNIIPVIDGLTGAFDEILIGGGYPAALHNAVLGGLAVLNKYYSLTDNCVFYRMAVLLHPSLRLRYLEKAAGWLPEWTKVALKIAQDYYKPYRAAWEAEEAKKGKSGKTNSNPATTTSTTSIARGTIAAFLTAEASNSTSSSLSDDPVLHFASSKIDTLPNNVLHDPFAYWWSRKQAGEPMFGLTEMALDIFSAPVSAVAVERCFSFGRHVVSEKRHRLSGATLTATMSLAAWARAGLVPDGLLQRGKEWRKAGKKMKALGRSEEVAVEEEEEVIIEDV